MAQRRDLLPDERMRRGCLEITKNIVQTCTQLENLLGWEPWVDPPSLGVTESARRLACQQLNGLVAKLLETQGFDNNEEETRA